MKKIIFILVIILATIIRIWSITSLPPSLFSDEVDIGYQATIFNQNHTDYFNNYFPIDFHSFSDYQPGLGIYTSAVIESITHSPELSVRLPSAIFGILSVVVLYFITGSIIPSFLLAISPWSIHYSRTGFAVSGMLFVMLLGIFFWQKYINSKLNKFVYLSILFFCLTPYFYSTAKLFLIFVPLIILIIYRGEILQFNRKIIISAVLFGIILLSPMVYDTLHGRSGFRFSYIGIFTEPHREQTTDTLRYQDAMVDHPNELGIQTTVLSKVLHNKYQLILQKFITNYISSFSTTFLLLTGDSNTRLGFGGHGLIYILDYVFFFIGLFFSYNKKYNYKLSRLFFWLLIFSPIPFALTRDANSPHATRLILMLPSIIYFTYLGITQIIKKYQYSKYLIFFVYLLSFFGFWHYYNYHYPQESAMVWHAGIKESVQATQPFTNNPLVFSNSYEPALPFFLLYHPYVLAKKTSISDHLIQTSNSSFDGQILDNKYYFGHINWSDLSQFPQNTIYVIPKSEYLTIPQSKFKVLQFIAKKYINQEEFYLLSL
jgi:hypothetical protein